MTKMIYLDFNATTPVDPRVLATMLPVFTEQFGNPSSVQHTAGETAHRLVEAARQQVANLICAAPSSVLFTSGATEAATLALHSILRGEQRRNRILVAATEHKAVLSAAEVAAVAAGGRVDTVRVDRCGMPDLDHLSDLLDDDVAAVAVMAANNESGSLCSLRPVAQLAHGVGALLLSDITQAAGKIPVDLVRDEVDMALLSSHKMYGPKGVGALVADRYVQRRLVAVQEGGGQERGLRGGTLNTPGIVGFGAAAEIAAKEVEAESERLGILMALLHGRLLDHVGEVELNGHPTERLPNTLNVRLVGADAEAVMVNTPAVAISTGSACQSAVPAPSHVLMAMGVRQDAAAESVRFSLGRPTTEGDVLAAVDYVAAGVERVRVLR